MQPMNTDWKHGKFEKLAGLVWFALGPTPRLVLAKYRVAPRLGTQAVRRRLLERLRGTAATWAGGPLSDIPTF
jgi:hypothetical protein